MKLKDYKKLKLENQKAFESFQEYISSGGLLRHAAIRLGLYLSFLQITKYVPVVSWVSQSAEGLLYGQISEHLSNQVMEKKEINTLSIKPVLTHKEEWDFIIIGSGPGAATAALKIPLNKNVLVLEAGKPSRIPNSHHHTFKHLKEDFYKSGQEVLLSWPLAQFAQGRVLGGGSEVNSGLYHRLPEIKLSTYSNLLGISVEQYKKSESLVHKLLNPNIKNENENFSVIGRGASQLGLQKMNVPRWRHYEKNGKFLHFGMAELVWKERIESKSVSILTGATVKKIDNSDKNRIQINYIDEDGKQHKIVSKRLVIAAGTINTPFLLAKSEIIKWKDIDFQWHPMLRTIVETKETDLGYGDIDPFQAWTDDYSLKFGSAVSTAGLIAVNMRKVIYQESIKGLRSYYVSFISSGKGGLIPYTQLPWYKYSEKDRSQFKNGAKALEELVSAGGGKFLNNRQPIKQSPSTVHIFGSLPANSTLFIHGTNQLVVDPRIYIADGSILPEGPGVNPQAIIMSAVDALTNFER